MSIINNSVTLAPSAATSVFTSAGNTAITTAYICNTSASTIIANLFAVPIGSVANNINKIYSNVSIASNDTLILEWERLIFSNGDGLFANASAAGLATTISYVGI